MSSTIPTAHRLPCWARDFAALAHRSRLVLAGLALLPSAAAAIWLPVQTLSETGYDAQVPRVAFDSAGSVLVVWVRNAGGWQQIKSRYRPAGGSYGPVLGLNTGGESSNNQQLAFDPVGNALVVWDKDGRVQARVHHADGSLGRLRFLSAASIVADLPRMAMDAAGNAFVAWLAYNDDTDEYRVQARVRGADGSFGPVRTLSAGGSGILVSWLDVAADPAGNAFAVWRRFDGAIDRIQGRVRHADGSFGPVRTLSLAGGNATTPQVAFDPDGNALEVWRYSTDSSDGRIQARVRHADGSFGPVRTLSLAGGDATTPQVAFDPDGNALVVWRRPDGANGRVQARFRYVDGSFGPVWSLSEAGGDAFHPDLAFDPSGNAYVVWSRFGGTYFRIQARFYRAADE